MADQECIDQEDPVDKELGIQAMDKIYKRAYLSIGLLQGTVESQESLDSLALLVDSSRWDNSSASPTELQAMAAKLLPFFELVAGDPWHTRAWVLQEAFSSGSRMNLLLRRTAGVSVKGVAGISHILSVTEIVIHMDTLLMVFTYAHAFFSKLCLITQEQEPLNNRCVVLLKLLRNILHGEERFIECKWTNQSEDNRPRRSCNAAVAVTYLHSRDNTRIADRLAIIANLCDNRFRLNTSEVEKHHRYLGACVLALALINQDFSLLYPEAYRSPALLIHGQ